MQNTNQMRKCLRKKIFQEIEKPVLLAGAILTEKPGALNTIHTISKRTDPQVKE